MHHPPDAAESLRRLCATPLPHPDPEAMRAWAAATLDSALADFVSLPERSLGRAATRPELEALLRESAPEVGEPFHDVLRQFAERVLPHAVRVHHPRFLAFVPGAPSFPAILGDWLCAAANFFAGVWLEAAGPSMVELVVLDWFRDWLGLPATTAGILTSGGSEANLTALVAAREQVPFAHRSRACLYVSAQRHWSIDRAARIIGLAPEQIQLVPTTADLKLCPHTLRQRLSADRAEGWVPLAVVASAGATNTGAIDPLADIAAVCRELHAWFHIDAAYGWAAVLDADGRQQLAGIADADSITLDPHKWLAQPFEVGCVLVRRGELLRQAFTIRPEYMQDVEPADDEVNFADHGLALTRRFRALKVWFSVKVLGLGWFRNLATHCLALARYAECVVERAGFEVLSPAQLSIVCFRARHATDPDGLNLRLIDAVRETGEAFLSSTRLRGQVALRFCFVNWRTTAADVDHVVTLLLRLAAAQSPWTG